MSDDSDSSDTGSTTYADDSYTSADYVEISAAASDSSWASWDASLEADSNATEAWYAGDDEASAAWEGVADDYAADSYAADSASWEAWDASYTADATSSTDDSTAYSSSYDASSSWAATDTVTDHDTDATW